MREQTGKIIPLLQEYTFNKNMKEKIVSSMDKIANSVDNLNEATNILKTAVNTKAELREEQIKRNLLVKLFFSFDTYVTIFFLHVLPRVPQLEL